MVASCSPIRQTARPPTKFEPAATSTLLPTYSHSAYFVSEESRDMNVVNRTKSVVVRLMIISMLGWLVTACEKPLGLLFPTSRPPGFEIVNHNSEWKPIVQEFGGVQMALVPAGCFQWGSTDEQIDYAVTRLGAQRFWMDKEKLVNGQCFDKPFWIDLTEVTNAQFNTFGDQASRTSKWTAENCPREMSLIERMSYGLMPSGILQIRRLK